MFIQCEFNSEALGYPTRVDVILPDRIANRKYPVLYLLHGGDGAPWFRHTAVERYAQEAEIAVVMPYSRNTCWRKAEISFPGMDAEPPKLEDFELFMMKELREIVCRTFPISDKSEETYIAGLSLGGYGAAYYGVTNPESFAEVGIFSGYLFKRKMFEIDRSKLSEKELKENLLPELVQPLKDFHLHKGRLPRFFVMNGTKDIREFSPVYAELLRAGGADVFTDFTSYEYGHEWAMWEICIRMFIEDIKSHTCGKDQ